MQYIFVCVISDFLILLYLYHFRHLYILDKNDMCLILQQQAIILEKLVTTFPLANIKTT